MRLRHYLDVIDGKITWGILRLFVFNPIPYTGRHIAEIVKVNHVTCSAKLEKLVNAGILKKTITGKSYLFQLNHSYFMDKVIAPLIRKEFELYPQIQKEIENAFGPDFNAIIIYGGYAKKRETLESDLDVCLISKEETNLTQKQEDFISEFREKYLVSLEVNLFSREDFVKNLNKPVIKSIVHEGDWLRGSPSWILGRTH